ncbi:MAG: hypothetical protein OEQ74_00250 [Gammaproteobacteria bacterium]|nr:hypothetical protein [Gammaproteobacteria bacterium]
MYRIRLTLAIALFFASNATLNAQDLSAEVADLRQMLVEMKNDYENRIEELESRLDRAERSVVTASRDADDAVEIAEQAATDATAGASAPNIYNPAIGVVLVGRYANVDPGWEAVPGFIPGGELGPGSSGFSLGESELNMNANIDTHFFGNLTLALEDEAGETEVAAEEAWIQTTGLPNGLSLLAGRYFSGAGYLNKFHRHADDFGDRPLPYQAFFGGQYIPDGLQLRWIAPTPLFLEFGAEQNWGNSFPSTGRSRTSPDARTFFAKAGGDAGVSHSWQLGLSYVSADVVDRGGVDIGGPPAEVFTGDSDLVGLDFVWKWAPGGNSTVQNFKLQGEYFNRTEDGIFAGLPYGGDQNGWYLQGIWQFRQGWRTGFRHDEVDADNGSLFTDTILEDPGRSSERNSLMIEWSLSEYSLLRAQYIDDRVLDASDNQFLLQYIMSLGAHGVHEF